jgi:hypothetical protein
MKRYLTLAVAFALACGRREAPVTCMRIGCVNTLTVEVQNAPSGPLSIRATPIGSADTAVTVMCPGDSGCINMVAFPIGFAPALRVDRMRAQTQRLV